MNNIQIFSCEQFGSVRTVQQEESILFVAVDVCKALGLSNPSKAVSRLDDDERANLKLGRQGNTNVVNEYGLYNLVLSSRKPEAKAFKRWITHEVIPTIRKTGRYEVPKAAPSLIKYFNGLRVVTKQDLVDLLKISKGCLNRCINHPHYMKPGKDYFLLEGRDLFEFRTRYRRSPTNRLTLITASGVEKILDAQRIDVPITMIFPVDENYQPEQPQELPQQQTLLPPPLQENIFPSRDKQFMELYSKAKGYIGVLDDILPLCCEDMEPTEHAGLMTSAFIASARLTKTIQDMQYINLSLKTYNNLT